MAPNCPSLTHVTFAALRVEPVLWRFGQAAGTAVQVALATHRGMALQDVNVTAVQDKLYEQGIVYHYPFRQYCDTPVPPPPPPPAPPKCKTLQVRTAQTGPTKEKKASLGKTLQSLIFALRALCRRISHFTISRGKTVGERMETWDT
jgi:hypothetical protein